MEVSYRKLFLKDLKRLKKQYIYKQIYDLAFKDLPKAKDLRDITGAKPMRSPLKRYRIRIGDYRVGIEVNGKNIEVLRALHRREFYQYFP